jgi:large subunit ribosomal protein L25
MAREKIEIPVTARTSGKHHSRSSRIEGKIPAVIYGPKTEPMNVLADELTVRKYQGSKFESSLFTLKGEGKANGLNVILRDVQVHPMTRRPLHVDFYAPDMAKPVRVNVELRLVGKAQGLAEGGLLEHLLRELEIEVLPLEIPEFIEADVTNLGLNEALHVSDLQVGKGVRVISLPTLTIATVAVPREEAAPVAAAPGAEAAPAAGAAAPAAGAAAPAAAAAAPAKK